jgi:hypothetical protein
MNPQEIKTAADGAAVVVGVAGFMQWFPPVVGLIGGVLTVVWFAIRIWETDTVKGFTGRANAKQDQSSTQPDGDGRQ